MAAPETSELAPPKLVTSSLSVSTLAPTSPDSGPYTIERGLGYGRNRKYGDSNGPCCVAV